MPLYTYVCDACGEFADWRSMSRSQEPSPCPRCGDAAARAVCAPSLALMAHNSRVAHHRNERAADQPMVMTGHQVQSSGRKRAGLPGCHHHRGHPHDRGHRQDGFQVHKSDRPWMIGH